MLGYRKYIPEKFTPEQRAAVLTAAGAAQALALEPKTQQKVDVVALSYRDFMKALDLPVTFESAYICMWLVDYVRHGYRATSLPDRFGSLRKDAKRLSADFPQKGARGHELIQETIKGLKKVDPSATDPATVVSLNAIEACLDHWGITAVEDYGTCNPDVCATAVRALMCHCGMMRGVESRSGLRLSDVKQVAGSHVEVLIAERYSEKKGKNVPGRTVILPITNDRTSAGAAMVKYINRFHGGRKGDCALFFRFHGRGANARPMRHRPASDKYFIEALKGALSSARFLTPAELRKVSNHSLRAGGATDFFVNGVSAELIRAQGGWRTFCFLVYVRPAREHRWKVAAQMVQALRAARE